MRRLAILLAALLCGVIVAAIAQDTPAPKPAPKTVTKTWSEPPAVVAPVPASGRRELSLREARRLGITIQSIRGAVKELKESGDIVDGETSRAEAAVLVAGKIQASNAQAYGGLADLDWEQLFALIEKILALFML